MKVVKVDWIDEEQKEADVIISDGINSVVCFSCPFVLKQGDTLNDNLHCLGVENLVKSSDNKSIIVKKEEYYAYFLRGELKNKEDKIVWINKLQINISDSDLPGDINDGDFIEFDVERLDVY